jgi:agmatine deiminase
MIQWRMPAEWEPHEATWMIFPPAVYDGPITLDDARRAWANVIEVVASCEPVHLLVQSVDRRAAEDLLGDAVTLHEAEIDDAWARDTCGTFIVGDDGSREVIVWPFNGWGGQTWARWDHDRNLAQSVAEFSGWGWTCGPITTEGGGIEVDGAGTVLLTETVQLDPGRGGEKREKVERIMANYLGADRSVWLARGLSGDYEEFGTRGHVDLVAKFAAPGRVLLHTQLNSDHPDASVTRAARKVLEAAGIETVDLIAPQRREASGRVCDWSYVNCYLANGAVIAGIFDDPADEAAVEALAAAYAPRRVLTVDARTLFALGGGVHCITQQQPAVRRN